MGWSDVPVILGAAVFAALIILLAELNTRRENKRHCKCGHRRNRHNPLTDQCEYAEAIGGLKFICYCSRFRAIEKVRS